MKTICAFGLTTLLFVVAIEGFSQPTEQKEEVIRSCPVEITYNKTTSIIFPAVIKSVDRGSRDLLAQKAKGVGNVLQLKAGRDSFPETNLTVITADGILHHFTVNYSEQPSTLTLDINKTEGDKTTSLIFQSDLTETDLENYSSAIVNAKRTVHSINDKQYKMTMSLLGVYIKDDAMFYHFRILNKSNIDYDVDLLKFYVRDKAKMKRTASQEIEVHPIYKHGEDKSIKGKSMTDVVYVFEKFTIPKTKLLQVEIFEHNGGRNLNLEIKNKTIDKAQLLPK